MNLRTHLKNMLYDGYICIYLHEMLLLKQGYLQPNAFLQRDKIKSYNDGGFYAVQDPGPPDPGTLFWPYHSSIYYS